MAAAVAQRYSHILTPFDMLAPLFASQISVVDLRAHLQSFASLCPCADQGPCVRLARSSSGLHPSSTFTASAGMVASLSLRSDMLPAKSFSFSDCITSLLSVHLDPCWVSLARMLELRTLLRRVLVLRVRPDSTSPTIRGSPIQHSRLYGIPIDGCTT